MKVFVMSITYWMFLMPIFMAESSGPPSLFNNKTFQTILPTTSNKTIPMNHGSTRFQSQHFSTPKSNSNTRAKPDMSDI